MASTTDIEKDLLNVDGSARDITFAPVALEQVDLFLKEFAAAYAVGNATDEDGKDVAAILAEGRFLEICSKPSGMIFSVWRSEDQMIPELQVFISWPEMEGKAFLEVTFFPQDLPAGKFNLQRFFDLVDGWGQKLQAEDYFVRYEGLGPDVIFSKRDRAQPLGTCSTTELNSPKD